MSQPVRVILLYGGRSGEHEVSLISAASVLLNLSPEKYEVIPVGMDKAGCFFRNDWQEMRGFAAKGALPVRGSLSTPIASLLMNGRLAIDADVVFPIAHGSLYEDGCLQGLLELADVAYVGCDVLASAIGMHKTMARRLIQVEGVEVAPSREISSGMDASFRARICQESAQTFGFPLFVKPMSQGSSVGVHKVHTPDALTDAVADALRYDRNVLIEGFVKGREIELSVLESEIPGEPARVSLPGEICVHHPDGFYSYNAKYVESDKNELVVPAVMPPALQDRLQEAARTIFAQLGCRGMARADFFVDDVNNRIFFNEINTLPGFTPFSMYPRMWEASGLSYTELLDTLIRLAGMHHRAEKQLVTDYQ